MAVYAVVDARLQCQHRLLVATCFGLVTLNMICEEEDFVKAFLVPFNLDQTWLWEGVLPPRKKKEEAKVDEEGKDVEEGKNQEEEKVEEIKEEKSDEERDHETRPSGAKGEYGEQTDETFPPWIPSGCNKKVCLTLQYDGDVNMHHN